MPLKAGSSKKVISHNIHEMVAAGHPAKQAVAASLHKANYAEGGEVEDDQSMLLEHVAGELMEAIEKKNKELLMEALTALVLYIQDEDEKQDAQEEQE